MYRHRLVPPVLVAGLLSLAACIDPADTTDASGNPEISNDTASSGGSIGVAPDVTVSGLEFVGTSGSEVVLRGVDVQADAGSAVYQQAAGLGANFLRVVTHWSQAETTAPAGSGTDYASYTHTWNASYLAQVDALVQWAQSHHIHVLIDFHQASWSPYFGGFGGVPAWYYKDGRFDGGKYSSSNPGPAIAAFWTSEAAMSQALFKAFAKMMVKRYSSYANVVGYEIFNEPNPGALTGTQTYKTNTMLAWQVPIRDAIYALDGRRAIFFMCRGGGDGVATADFSLMGDLVGHHMVLDVHSYYVGLYPGKDASGSTERGLDTAGDDWYPSVQATHNNLQNTGPGGTNYHGQQPYHEAVHSVWQAKAHSHGIPFIIGEWGANENDTGLGAYQTQFVNATAKYGISWTRWQLATASCTAQTLNVISGCPAYASLKNLIATVPGGHVVN